MRHYDYLDAKPQQDKRRKSILYIGYALVFLAVQQFYPLANDLPPLIVGNLIILWISYILINKELMIITILMFIALLSRLA
jgi:hypothetical protein